MSGSSIEIISYEKPFVSVIVPVYNDDKRIGFCIEALLAQTCPKENYEILIVDNGSKDKTREVVRKYPVKLLIESRIQSSYAARNKAIHEAKGQIFAFTDADCIPSPSWLDEGINVINSQHVDLVGGSVKFVFSSRTTGAEIWDSLTNMQIEKNIAQRAVAKTANLFVRSNVFNEIGVFPANIQSGGDVIWTKMATGAGYKLSYAPLAQISHPARCFGALWKKQFRVGKGQAAIWSSNGLSWDKKIRKIARYFLPISPGFLKSLLVNHPENIRCTKFWRVWFSAWMVNVATGLGAIIVW